MAAIHKACDVVILWLNPQIPVSHYQMPYKLTDALAMQVPVIANDISDLGELAREGFLKLADFKDYEGLYTAINEIFDNKEETNAMLEKGRRLFLRQFSYSAFQSQFELISKYCMSHMDEYHEVSNRFMQFRQELFAKGILI